MLKSHLNYNIRARLILSATRNSSSSEKSSQDSFDKKNAFKKENKNDDSTDNETAAQRLNRLLASMKSDEKSSTLQKESLARPRDRKKQVKVLATENKENVIEAAKRVASLLGKNVKETESELLTRLLHIRDPQRNDSQKLEEEPTSPKTNVKDMSLSELIVGMRIDRNREPKPQTRGEYVREAIQSQTRYNEQFSDRREMYRRQRSDRNQDNTKDYSGSVNLFGAKPLDIFKDSAKLQDSPDMLKTWEHLEKRDLQIQVTHPPENYFQKMALWTKQGKIWKFPINNEQGMEEEATIDFTEHIFLEQHLEEWCPTKGPIRHFMELVCVGLSKNPYITAKEKKDHILWYREYFENKKDILKDLMSQEKMDSATKSTQNKQISSTS